MNTVISLLVLSATVVNCCDHKRLLEEEIIECVEDQDCPD
jgi:hypothetical protein